MITLPANLGFGTVVGRFGTSDEAYALADRLTVTFTPTVDYVIDRTATPPITMMLFDTTCNVDEDGYLIDDTGAQTITLPATDDTDLDPHSWVYKVTTQLAGGTTPFPEFYIAVPQGTTVDLATVIPSTFSRGVASAATVSAAATDAATTQTLANSLRAALIALGIVS